MLESFQGELQDPNWRSEQDVMDAQSPGSANRDNFETPLWESREKMRMVSELNSLVRNPPPNMLVTVKAHGDDIDDENE
jgi:hypothetical protein